MLTDIQLQAARLGIDPVPRLGRARRDPDPRGDLADLFEVETGDWPRYGVKGAAIHVRRPRRLLQHVRRSSSRPAARRSPQRHLYEEVYYVLEGRGSTQLEFADGRKRSFEWGPRSFFAIPLNAKYRHFNASGTQRALLVTTTCCR